MKSKILLSSEKKFIVYISIVVLIILAFFVYDYFKNSDFVEIKKVTNTITKIYESESGFENDKFTIHEFTLKSNTTPLSFQKDDGNLSNYVGEFSPLIDKGIKGKKIDPKFKEELEKIVNSNSTKFLKIQKGSTTKLYIYNPSDNKGYVFIFII